MPTNFGAKIAALLGIGVLAAGVGFGAHYFIDTSSAPNPDVAMQTALRNLEGVKTTDANVSLVIATDASKKLAAQTLSFDLGIMGDMTDKLNPKIDLNAAIKLPTDPQFGAAAFLGKGNMNMGMRILDKKVYVIVREFPQGLIDASPIFNQWIEINTAELDPSLFKATSTLDYQDPRLVAFREKIMNSGMAHADKNLGKETLNGKIVYHYTFVFDRDKISAFLPEYQKFVAELDPRAGADLAQQIPQMQAELAKLQPTDLPTGDFWVEKGTLLPVRILISKDITIPEKDRQQDMPSLIHASMAIDYRSVNQPVSIVAPANTITTEEASRKIKNAQRSSMMSPTFLEPNSPQALGMSNQFARARDTQRSANINTILNAVGQNMADNRGVFTCAAGPIPTTPKEISSLRGGYNLAICVVPTYLPELGVDPGESSRTYWNSADDYKTGYRISQDTYGRVTISAPFAEITKSLSVTR